MLAGINAHEQLSESWVFKGGALSLRSATSKPIASEDLDFYFTRGENHLDAEFLRTVFEEIVEWVTEQSGLTIDASPT